MCPVATSCWQLLLKARFFVYPDALPHPQEQKRGKADKICNSVTRKAKICAGGTVPETQSGKESPNQPEPAQKRPVQRLRKPGSDNIVS